MGAVIAQDNWRGREIGTGDDPEQLLARDRGILEEGEAAIDHLAQVMRRDIGRHANRDAARAVNQQVGESRRQHCRFAPAAVVVVGEIDGVLVEIVEQAVSHPCQPRLGIAHRSRIVGVHRTEIALAIDQRHPQRPILRHADQREVDRAVAVRMVIAHHVADDLGAFAIRAPGDHAAFLRREQDAAMHRLQTVAHIGERAAHDHAHRVIEIAGLHLIDDVDAGVLITAESGRIDQVGFIAQVA